MDQIKNMENRRKQVFDSKVEYEEHRFV